MFWPGSEAAIGGVSPTRWWPFDGSVPNEERVRRVLDWLSLPEGERPAFVSLYFQEVDHIGHVSGPDSPEVLEAAAHLDAALGQLRDRHRSPRSVDRVNIVVVSDHGMAPHTDDQMVFLDTAIDPATVNVIATGEFVQLAPPPGRERDRVEHRRDRPRRARQAAPRDVLQTRGDSRAVPLPRSSAHRPDHRRRRRRVDVTTREQEARRKPDAEARRGAHGYDPALRSMHGLFVAAGPESGKASSPNRSRTFTSTIFSARC